MRTLSSFLLLSIGLSLSSAAIASSDPSDSDGLRHLFFKFGGIFLLDYTESQDLINQTRGGDQVVLDDVRSGYRLMQNETMGLGLEGAFHFPVPVGVTVGLDLMAGKNASFDRFAQSKEEVKTMGSPRLPSHASDLAQWKTGDNVLFRATGGVGFSSGFGIVPVAGAAAYVFAEGDWFLYVEKTSDTTAYMKVTNTAIQSLGVLAESVIVGISTDLFHEADSGFSYSYNLEDADSRFAYEDAMHGNLEPSDRLPQVTKIQDSESASFGLMRNWYFGVPFVAGIGGSSGQVREFTNLFNHADGSSSRVESGIYVDHAYSGGIFSKHVLHMNDFIGSHVAEKTSAGDVSMTSYDGQYYWAFESPDVSSATVRKELQTLALKTSIPALGVIAIPNQDKLGYLDIKFSAQLPQAAMDLLMNYAKDSPSGSNSLAAIGTRGVSQYFQDGRDPLELCADPSEPIPHCEARLINDTDQASRNMRTELKAMLSARDSDAAEFSRHFGEFGKQMATNPFTFHEIVELTRAAPMTMKLVMEGERISVFSLAVE